MLEGKEAWLALAEVLWMMNWEVVAGSGLTSLIHSTAVVQQSSVIRPTPLSKIETQTNLNLPPTNWLKDNPSSKGENHPFCKAKRSSRKLV